MDNQICFNIILIGDHSYRKKYIKEQWIGVEFRVKIDNIKIEDNQDEIRIKQKIFDFNGACRFIQMTKESFYKNANGFILCFSNSNRDSYNHLIDWINDINTYYEYSEKTNFKKPTILIIGLKSDEPSQVEPEELIKFCESLSIPFINSVSSKNNINVENVFKTISILIYKNGSFNINNNNNNNTKNNNCLSKIFKVFK
ncbi:hypothetical protein DICPUDRAFT_160488 [Dictyostelium purpureum]|uniref:Small GTPase n=1 Tax=Dictyostelium purpureum TaxID=5786 RepID=F1A6E2_DICPU|nr:uncharacterized protein DICPUDRAFT_160488 [Dictyostelium purpureum]EGC28239.1 hypothetical protein DICPUDRAFT_160488 [Dictyostelium purpureum]|eukprot:XP_003295236.1 hypothetical protein DICPUDRAFT_160488 [Dictyostelium purpureum]